MPARELTTATQEPREDESAIQVVRTLPLRPRGQGSGKGWQPDPESRARIPRITRLMALAIKFQDMVARGEVRDFADLARLGHVTRARLTQIMNLLLLAPQIQEEILRMSGQATMNEICERDLRPVTRIDEWRSQRQAWERLRTRRAKPSGPKT